MTQATAMPIDTVRAFYALLAAGNFPDAFGYVSPDAVIREPADLPFGGDFRGAAEHGRLLQQMGAVIDLGIDRHTILDGAETDGAACFAVKLKARFTPRDGGEPLLLDLVELITVSQGRIVEIDVYHKTPSAVSAIWPQ